MQAQLSNNSYIPGLNGGPEFTNWNWNMQSFQPPILGVPGSNNYGDFNFNNLDMSNFAESNLNLENGNSNSEYYSAAIIHGEASVMRDTKSTRFPAKMQNF